MIVSREQSGKKAHRLKKEKTLTLGSKLEVAEGEDVDIDESVDG
jgi:hypothetical protein